MYPIGAIRVDKSVKKLYSTQNHHLPISPQRKGKIGQFQTFQLFKRAVSNGDTWKNYGNLFLNSAIFKEIEAKFVKKQEDFKKNGTLEMHETFLASTIRCLFLFRMNQRRKLKISRFKADLYFSLLKNPLYLLFFGRLDAIMVRNKRRLCLWLGS